jgi:hypothetical protein
MPNANELGCLSGRCTAPIDVLSLLVVRQARPSCRYQFRRVPGSIAEMKHDIANMSAVWRMAQGRSRHNLARYGPVVAWAAEQGNPSTKSPDGADERRRLRCAPPPIPCRFLPTAPTPYPHPPNRVDGTHSAASTVFCANGRGFSVVTAPRVILTSRILGSLPNKFLEPAQRASKAPRAPHHAGLSLLAPECGFRRESRKGVSGARFLCASRHFRGRHGTCDPLSIEMSVASLSLRRNPWPEVVVQVSPGVTTTAW